MSKHNWPAWFYGPNGQSDVFDSADDVPAGWVDHPSKVEGAEKPQETEVDKSGVPWDEKLHAPDKSKTAAGLWRMKVGVTRPPVLDL